MWHGSLSKSGKHILFCQYTDGSQYPFYHSACMERRKAGCSAKMPGKGQMEACVITKEEDLEEGKFGIMEPKAGCKVLMPEQIDLIVLPCLSCDKKGNRLGYGGGYYDRYLEKCTGVRVVICREKLMLDEIPAESFDQKGDFLITEKGICPIKG